MARTNARDWVFEVSEDPSAATPVWAKVGKLTSFDLNNSEGEESTDTTTFDSEGVAESQAMQRGASCGLEGQRDKTDAGQIAVDAVAELVGEDSLVGFRFRHTDDTEWIVWTAWASKGNNGGGNNDKTSWGATFTRSGAATTEPTV